MNSQLHELSHGVEVLNLTTSLDDHYAQSGQKLLSRTTTRDAWKKTFNKLKTAKRVAMMGVPGIGKSRNLFYGLRELLRREEKPKVIVFEARIAERVFMFTREEGKWSVGSIHIQDWRSASCKELKNKENFYLIDAYQPGDRDADVAAKTIKACSPDTRHHSGFVKETGTYVYVEAWSAAEVKAAHAELENAPPVEVMLQRMEKVGGNLRVLLSDNDTYNAYVSRQRGDAKSEAVVEQALSGNIENNDITISSRLFTYVVKDGQTSVDFASPRARELVLRYHYEKLMTIWSNPNEPVSTSMFEQVVGQVFSTKLLESNLTAFTITGERPKRKMNWEVGPGWELVHERKALCECDTVDSFEKLWREAVQSGSLNQMLRCPPRYAGIDYLLDYNHGIQATTKREHNISGAFLETLKDIFKEKKDVKFTLTFIVPREADKFRPDSDDFLAFKNLTGNPFASVEVNVAALPRNRRGVA